MDTQRVNTHLGGDGNGIREASRCRGVNGFGVMSDHELAERYEGAISLLQPYIRRTDQGTLRLEVTKEDLLRLQVDPVVFVDLQRSLTETNKKIKRGEVTIDQVLASIR
jgi:hypothetical protein